MSKLTPPVGPGDHILGDVDAPVTLVEYGDFECPYCGRAHLMVQDVLRRVGRDVRFVFRHFPLAELHPHALAASEAAEAAGAQGKFWAMHDTLFEHQDALGLEDLVGYATDLGLDTERFADELASHAHLDKVKAEVRSGVRSGVNGTPTFFIDEVRFDDSWDADTLTATLRAAIRAKTLAATG
ncbi:disulfide bond formation protein DsbA [Sorangium cellulosum]|uniref:Disulfide bond formation protein DsbA n=1 Tax=Sorangium cellulosum TaxID=56 RepID=A0A150QTK5_SORCE|nr:disulfide bond formation protein DsbA [Sorangium cellulosum]